MQTISGAQLKTLMQLNRKSITRSAQDLGISVTELESYFEYESFEMDHINRIVDTLRLKNVVDLPNAYTPAALDRFEEYEQLMKMQRELLGTLSSLLVEIKSAIKANGHESIYNQITDPWNETIIGQYRDIASFLSPEI